MNTGLRQSAIHARLRRETAAAHAVLDARVSPMLLGSEADYVAFLRGAAGAVLPLEQAVEAAGIARLLPDWASRRRTAALDRDLRDFGVEAGRLAPVVLPPGDAFLLGAVYVLEGSRLGGLVMARVASTHASARVRATTRFLRHGAEQGLWPRFLSCLEASAAARRAPHEAIAGAKAAFAVFAAAYGDLLIDAE